jgi:hypothetical protein
MSRNIEFYIPKSEIIPTRLLLKVDGKQVNYEKAKGCFGYDFEFFNNETLEEAMDITKEIASIMSSQSYDHGAEWSVVSIEPIKPKMGPRYNIMDHTIRVTFRWKDMW